ncbi:MAG TPA: histidine kinase N-terminal 7TM domain-containing protein [Anaerolineaceae bacterium]|nr:histidine kinase N-terminal 7TM domain-containing protein [Anaerolineaceae bacterium]
MQFNPYTWALVLTAALSGGLALYIWQRRSSPAAAYFGLVMLTQTIWAFTYGMEVASTNLSTVMFWVKLEYFGIATLSPLWLLFAVAFSGREHWLQTRWIALLFIIPTLTIFIVATNELHSFYYTSVAMDYSGEIALLSIVRGPWYFVHTVYSYLCVIAGAILMLQQWWGSSAVYRRQIATILFAVLGPWIISIFYVLGWGSVGVLDLTPFGFILSSVTILYSLLREQLLDLMPLVRGSLLDELQEGVLILNERGNIVGLNDAARRFLSVDGGSLIGLPVLGVLPRWTEVYPLLVSEVEAETEVHINGDDPRHLDVRVSPLRGRQGELTGRLMIMHDITRHNNMEQALRESERRYRHLVEHSPEALIVHRDGLIIYANPAALRLFRAPSLESIINQQVMDYVHPDYRQIVIERIRENYERGKPGDAIEEKMLRVDGEPIDVEVASVQLTFEYQPATLVIVHDITESKRAMRELDDTRRLAEALRDTASALNSTLNLDEVFKLILDRVRMVVPADIAAVQQLDAEHKVAITTHAHDFSSQGLDATLIAEEFEIATTANLRQMVETRQPVWINDVPGDPDWKQMEGSEWIRSYLGAPILIKGQVIGFLGLTSAQPNFYCEEHAPRLMAFADQAAIAIENAQLYAEVQRLAVLDDLTGIYNRRAFFDLGQREVERALRTMRPMCALFLDIDHFKQFNDAYSYQTGDQVLRLLAECLKTHLREIDLVGRYGGEEFMVLLPEADLPSAMGVAERLRQQVQLIDLVTEHGKLSITISIGVATLPLRADQQPGALRSYQVRDLIDDAGEALHLAKDAGRNCIASLPED